MNIYNINLTLDIVNNKSPTKMFNINDFSKELIELINDIYAKDFEMFNYEKILVM
jgi:predicted transcriptional regulator with HTH domain